MPYTAPATVVDGNIGPASWGNSVKAATDYLANPPACRVWHNASQSLVDNTPLAMAFNSERYDTDTMHDTVTNNSRITIKTAGLYLISGHIEIPPRSDYVRGYAAIKLNGTTYLAIDQRLLGNINNNILVATVYKFAVNDYVQLEAFQDNTGGITVTLPTAASWTPEFAATWIGLG